MNICGLLFWFPSKELILNVAISAQWWYHDVWKSSGWDVEDAAATTGRTRQYRTIPPALLQPIRMSMPAYDYLRTLTSAHRDRAVSSPPSGKLYEDPRNEHVLVFVGTPSIAGRRGRGRIVPRDMAAISPFDSSVQGGDATWGESIESMLFVP